jgi:GNAT superfamily N-acetyltransferase
VIALRVAQPTDIEVIAALWTRSADWLRSRGSDQWQYPVRRDNIARAIDQRTCWLAELDANPIATITVDERATPEFWYPSDDPDDALYVHRMVVDDSFRGRELGSALLDWAGRRTSAMQRRWLRLDAWRTNTQLHDYYLSRGFELVRLVDHPSGSGACFQRTAHIQLERGPALVQAPETCPRG